MWQQGKLDLKILEAWKREQEELGRLQQYAYVYVRQPHSVDEHDDNIHDEQCLCAGKTNIGIGTCLPNPFAWLRFFY